MTQRRSRRSGVSAGVRSGSSNETIQHRPAWVVTSTRQEPGAKPWPCRTGRHLAGLVRFLASAYGESAPGYAGACALLG
jgi:hypothetical protein